MIELGSGVQRSQRGQRSARQIREVDGGGRPVGPRFVMLPVGDMAFASGSSGDVLVKVNSKKVKGAKNCEEHSLCHVVVDAWVE